MDLMIQADTLNTLSSEKSNKHFCLTVVPNMFLMILASFSDSLDLCKIGWSGHFLFFAIYEKPFHQISEILLNRLPSARFCLVGT